MEIDGAEIEVESMDVTHKTGRKLVKTMNKTGRPAGFARGVAEIDLKLSVVIPLTGDIDWKALQGVKITSYPVGSGVRTSYLDCFTIEVGSKYTVDGEAKRDLTMAALREVAE
jgi:hypothetical protein